MPLPKRGPIPKKFCSRLTEEERTRFIKEIQTLLLFDGIVKQQENLIKETESAIYNACKDKNCEEKLAILMKQVNTINDLFPIKTI